MRRAISAASFFLGSTELLLGRIGAVLPLLKNAAAFCPVSLSPPEHARWFVEEVQVHEKDLRAYLQRAFRFLPDIDNLVQEAFARVCGAKLRDAVQSPRALLFTTARHLAVDQIRRHKIIPMESVAEMDDLPVVDQRAGVAETVSRTQELDLLRQAIKSLPDRCGQVLTLRKIYGLSQKQIAAQLGIAESTVETQVAKGMRRCYEFLARHGLP